MTDAASHGSSPDPATQVEHQHRIVRVVHDDTASSVLAAFDKEVGYYATEARQARQWHYVVGLLLIVTGASVSVVALAFPGQSVTVAALGAVVVVLTGARAFFRWEENWYRFTGACQALKQERRKYDVGLAPYDNPATCHRELAKALNRIVSAETREWDHLKDMRSADAPAHN